MSLNGEWPAFTVEEKEVLRQSWCILNADLEGLGILIYQMIFDQCPNARTLFPFMKHSECNEKKPNKDFVFQALRFVQIFETAIEHLDNLSGIDSILDNLGRRHGRLESSIGFKQYYWVVFRECSLYKMRKVLTTSKKSMSRDDVDNAIVQWRRLLDKLVNQIERGYERDLINRCNSIELRS